MSNDSVRNMLYVLTALVVLFVGYQLVQSGKNWFALFGGVLLLGIAWGIFGLRKKKVTEK